MIYILNDAGKALAKLTNYSYLQMLQYIRIYKLLDAYILPKLTGKALYKLSDSDLQNIVLNLQAKKAVVKKTVIETKRKTAVLRWAKVKAVKELKTKLQQAKV